MESVKFDPRELEIKKYLREGNPVFPPIPVFNSPISRRENFLRLIRGEHLLWMPTSDDMSYFFPTCVPDSWARGMVSSPVPPDRSRFGGKDMFGIEWEYVPQVRGSMVRPGAPFVKDLERWEDDMQFPDIETWDWEGCAESTEALRSDGRVVKVSLFTGFFERLISMVEMTDALLAMIDEDMQPAIHRLFDRLADLYAGIFEKYAKYFHPDGVWFHDDWGSQQAPFFHAETLEEMILPYLKRVADAAHENGMFLELHSCGHIDSLVPVMIEAGVDMWQGQPMNDKRKVVHTYGDRIIVDTFLPQIPKDAPEETVREVLQQYLDEFAGKRTYLGRNFESHPLENSLLYELSRKAFNP